MQAESWLCVGIDPELEWLPDPLPRSIEGIVRFSGDIVEATKDVAAAYKINFAFFEVLGPEGWAALSRVRRMIPAEIPVIGDAKRGDIGNTARAYARSTLDVMNFDAVTVSPYVGWDALEPFLGYSDKSVLVLAKTSNPGASALQDLPVAGTPLYLRVVEDALELETAGEIGFVVGATQIDALHEVRARTQHSVLLMPGVGAQGAGMREAVMAGANKSGANALGTASRQILAASSGRDYARAAARAAETLAAESWEACTAATTG